jgi:trk system potassium uptake protein TrkH
MRDKGAGESKSTGDPANRVLTKQDKKPLLERLQLDTLNLPIVARVLGTFIWLFSLTMLVPVLVELLQGSNPKQLALRPDADPYFGFLAGCGIGVLGGLALSWVGRFGKGEFFRREGILVVALLWVGAGLVGALPIWLTGGNLIGGYIDAVFETVSGLTTTGSSILGSGENAAIEEMPTAILFWRSWLHWIGGIGIVVMFLIFLPALGITEKALFQNEVAGLSKEGLKPRIRQTARTLLVIYLFFTLALAIGFMVFGMGLFDAVCHSFATIATGGFSTKNYSIGQFNSIGIEIVAIVGMLIAATNFGLYYQVSRLFRSQARLRDVGASGPRSLLRQRLQGSYQIFTRDPEWRFYFGTFVIVSLGVALLLWFKSASVPDVGEGRGHEYGNLFSCLRDAAFQTSSLISSTGFANSDLLTWPLLAQCIMMAIMLGGGCGGSTGGGVKAIRMLVLFRLLGRNLRRFLQPRAVEPLRIGDTRIEEELIDRVLALFVAWVLILALGSLALLGLTELDIVSAGTTMLTCVSNMGPGFTAMVPETGAYANAYGANISSYGSFGFYPDSAKVLMAFVMILGRLEVFTLLVIFMPSFWRD